MRITKHEYYLEIARSVASRSTCRVRHYGAVVVKDDSIVSTGYNGAPRGLPNCIDDACLCSRIVNAAERGTQFETCRSVHAEMNALLSAARRDTIGATIYIACKPGEFGDLRSPSEPCTFCRRLIINSGITTIVCMHTDGSPLVQSLDELIEKERMTYGSCGQ